MAKTCKSSLAKRRLKPLRIPAVGALMGNAMCGCRTTSTWSRSAFTAYLSPPRITVSRLEIDAAEGVGILADLLLAQLRGEPVSPTRLLPAEDEEVLT